MSDRTTTFALPDPRTFEGDPYEVAERASRQLAGVLQLMQPRVQQAGLMSRNAMMERNLQSTPDDARASEWLGSYEAKGYAEVAETLAAAEKKLNALATAGSFNPNARLPAA